MTGGGLARADVEAVLEVLAAQRGLDLRDYRPQTLCDGVDARMRAVAAGDLDAYLRRLGADPGEVERLLSALVVPVTELFRDRDVFAVLAAVVVPDLVRRLPRGPLRAWAIGVASGEEAWSLAMILASTCAARGVDFDLVASDLDGSMLARAREGAFSAAACHAVPAELRDRYLAEEQGGVLRVTDELRDHVHFAEHDLMGRTVAPREAVIASFHLVAMRNVLIYFDRRLQGKAVERVRAVLEPSGALVLGMAETLPEPVAGDFTPFPGAPSRLRIFAKRGGA